MIVMSQSDTPTDDRTEMKALSQNRSQLAQRKGGVSLHKAVEVSHLPNPIANHLNEKARQFEALFNMMMGRTGDDINVYDTIDTKPPHRTTVELSAFVELDGDQGHYELAVAIARRIEEMFEEEHQYHTERVNDSDDDPTVPNHQQYVGL